MSKFECSTDSVVFLSLRSELEFETSIKTSNDVDLFNLNFELIKDLNSNMNWKSDFDWSKRIWLHCWLMISLTEFKRVLRDNWCMKCFLNMSREDDRACIDCEDADENIIAIDISMSCWISDFLSDSSNVSWSVINLSFLSDVELSNVSFFVINLNFLSDVKSSDVNFFVINLSFLTSLASTISMSRSRLKLSWELELKLIFVWDYNHCKKKMINLN